MGVSENTRDLLSVGVAATTVRPCPGTLRRGTDDAIHAGAGSQAFGVLPVAAAMLTAATTSVSPAPVPARRRPFRPLAVPLPSPGLADGRHRGLPRP
ncbi:hypothetical protein GCM10020295_82210 [Streptomyces cinereospinus]